MNLTVISQPPFEPVTLAEVYAQLRLTPDHVGSPGEESHPDDAMLAAQITAAREYVEVATRRSMVQRTLRLSSEAFPYATGWWWKHPWTAHGLRIRLINPPLIRIESVAYYDGDNTLQTVAPADYYATDDQVPELRFAATFSAPALFNRPDAVRVEYVAGYLGDGSPPTTQDEYIAHIPQTLRQAVLIGVQLQYDNLSDSDRKAFENAREAMLQTYRIQHV